jgi:hypothetical protein
MEHWKCPCCGLDATNLAIRAVVYGLMREFDDLELTSSTRCEKYNKKKGGAIRSGHLPMWGPDNNQCVAADITLGPRGANWTRERARVLFYEAVNYGAMGIGLYDNHIHVDVKSRRQFWHKKDGRLEYFF